MLEVIPAINCLDSACVKKRFAQMRDFGNEWAHVDISDGKFTTVKSWNEPGELNTELKIEVHLMVERPEDFVEAWLRAGAKRLIVHIESFRGPEDGQFQVIIEKCSEAGAEVMAASNPLTPVEEVIPYIEYVYAIQCLAVQPGLSGQKFDEKILEKVEYLKERAPDIKIEVDGGINVETAKLVRRAGADIVVSASYIFNNKDPLRAYKNLLEIDQLLYESG